MSEMVLSLSKRASRPLVKLDILGHPLFPLVLLFCAWSITLSLRPSYASSIPLSWVRIRSAPFTSELTI